MTQFDREYAVALYALAAENGAQDDYVASLRVVVDALAENPEYMDFLASPGISIRERLAALEEAFANAVHEHVLSLVQLLCEKGRMAALSDIAAEYKRMVDEIARRLNLDSLRFSKLETLVNAIGLPKECICTHCFDGSSTYTLEEENK